MRYRPACLLLVTLSLSTASCGRQTSVPWGSAASSSTSPDDDIVVARVNGARIGRAAVLAEMRRTGKTARAALDHLIDDELLAAEAQRSIDPSAPDLTEASARAAVQRMLEHELEPHLDKSAIPDDALRSLYDRAHSAFVHPRLVEVALLSVYTGARMKDEPRARALETAQALAAYVRGRASRAPEDFKTIADEPAWRDRRVKYARLWQALDEPFPADVGRAVAALSHPGETSALIVAESGCYIARYVTERPAENVSFEAARATLREQMAERWRQAQFLEFAQAAANPHRIEAYPERLRADP